MNRKTMITKSRRRLASLAVTSAIFAASLAVGTSANASYQALLPSKTIQASTQRYIVAVDTDADVAALAATVRGLGGTVHDRFTELLSGFSASLTTAQAFAVADDPRVVSIEIDEKISLDSIEAGTTVGDPIPGRYIVMMKPTAKQSAVDNAVAIFRSSIKASFESAFDGYIANLSDSQLAELRADPAVQYVEQDRVVTITGEQTNPPWGLNRIDQVSLPLDNKYTDRTNGAGVTAYVLDTGIAPHAQFGNRVVTGRNFTSSLAGDNQTTDCHGHGTHVAGTIGSTTYGVAKGATLVPIRVLDCQGSGTTSGVIAGINWAINNHVEGVPAVLNMSLGGSISPALDAAVANAFNSGIVVVVAAGNDGTSNDVSARDACNHSPARAPLAITVGSSTKFDSRSSFSNVGTCVDLFAPGSEILSTWLSGGTKELNGTSMATPHVAGAVATLWATDLFQSATTVKSLVLDTASVGKISNAGTGSPNLLLYVDPTSTPPPPPPNEDSFASPLIISGLTGSTDSKTNYASAEQNEPSHAGSLASHSVWFNYSAPANGQLTVDTSESDFDSVLAIYTGSTVASLSTVAFNDDKSVTNQTSEVSFAVVANQTYRIAVDGYNGATGTVVLDWDLKLPTPPATPVDVLAISSRSNEIEVSWTHPGDNAYPVTSFTVTASPSGKTCTWTQGPWKCAIANLTNGQSYTFTVVANNPIGASASSAPSNAEAPRTMTRVSTTAYSWGIDRSDQRPPELDGLLATVNRGRGTTVFVLDTGISEHQEFGDRLLAGFSAIDDDLGTGDCYGHGTHVASTAVGSSYGIATDAFVVPVRVLDCNGEGTNATVIAGLDYVASYPLNGRRAVVNLSLGGPASTLLDQAVNNLIGAGVVVVAAAGNNDISVGQTTPNACLYSPARVPAAITVAASDDTDARAFFSNYGSCVDIFAPGQDINGASTDPGFDYVTSSGTSMAAPHVAGAAAIALTAFPTYTAAQIAQIINDDATTGILTDIGAGSPNRLLMVAGATLGVEVSPRIMRSINPTRIFDTRNGEGGVPVRQVGGDYILEVQVAGKNGVASSGVTSVSLNVTALSAQGTGYVTVYPCGTLPNISSLNFDVGDTTPNAVIARLSPTGTLCFYSNVLVDIFADISGSFLDGNGFVPVVPSRLLDTRSGIGGVASQKVGRIDGSGQALEFPVLGRNGVPSSGVAAISLNVTVTNSVTSELGGYVTVYPCGTPPNASNLNFVSGQTIPNAVITPVSGSGTVCFYVYGEADIIVDVNGTFESGLGFVPVAPNRIADTRSGIGGVPVGRVGDNAGLGVDLEVQVAGTSGIPTGGATAASLNVTALGVSTSEFGGYITAYPCDTRPNASILNFTAGQTVPNAVIAPLSSRGTVCFYAYGVTDIIVDTNGYIR